MKKLNRLRNAVFDEHALGVARDQGRATHGKRIKAHPNYCEEVDRVKEGRVGFEAGTPRIVQGGLSWRPLPSLFCAAFPPSRTHASIAANGTNCWTSSPSPCVPSLPAPTTGNRSSSLLTHAGTG